MKSVKLAKPIYKDGLRKAKLGENQPTVQNIVELTGFRVYPESVQNYVRKYQVLTENFNTALPENCGKKLLRNG